MILNEITNKDFDYSIVDESISNMLQAKAYRINQITSRSAYEIGKELFEAQQELAKHGYGFFEDWYRSLGFKTTESYQYINHYKFVSSESEESKIQLYESLPKSLQNEMAKPSAMDKLNQAVFDGDITTHKAYKDLEKKLKSKEESFKRQLEQKDEIINKAFNQIDDIINQEPQVIEKEVLPADYDQLKKREKELQKEIENLNSSLKLANSKYQILESSTAEAKELKYHIDSLKGEKNRLTNAIEAVHGLHDLENTFNEFFDKNMAPMKFKGIAKYLSATNATNRIHDLINLADAWVEEMRRLVPNNNRIIIEGEYQDDK